MVLCISLLMAQVPAQGSDGEPSDETVPMELTEDDVIAAFNEGVNEEVCLVRNMKK